jgi:hypothetical protein
MPLDILLLEKLERCSDATSRGNTFNPPGGDRNIMKAAAKLHAAIFDDARAPPLRAIGRRQFLKTQHTMGDAVHGLVGKLRGQIVEQHHCGAEFREIMLDRQDLTPIAQRTLRQQPDLGETVEHHPARPRARDRFENLLGGLAEFEVRRIEQALLLFGIEQALRRQQFEHFNSIIQCPAMGGRTVAQLAFGFGQSDVEAFLPAPRAFEQKLQCHGGLAGARRAFHQEYMAARKSAGQDVVQSPDARFRLVGETFDRVHTTP